MPLFSFHDSWHEHTIFVEFENNLHCSSFKHLLILYNIEIKMTKESKEDETKTRDDKHSSNNTMLFSLEKKITTDYAHELN